MSDLRIKFALNKGRHGIPMHKLAEVSKEAERFFLMLARDVNLGKGEWVADNFKNGSLEFDASYIGDAPPAAVVAGRKAISHLVDRRTTPDDLRYGIRRETFLQFAKIASPLDADESIGIGLYNGHDQPKLKELTKERALEIEKEITQTVEQYGGVQGVITTLFKESNILWIRELSTGERISCAYPIHMYEQVWKLLRAKDAIVTVEGWMTRVNGVIDHLKIQSMHEAAEYQEGDVDKFFGCDPEFTGPVSTEEYLHDLRGETTEEYLEHLADQDE
jgi:hypothetical protein